MASELQKPPRCPDRDIGGSVNFLKGVAQPLGCALIALARRCLGQAKFDASFGLAEAFDRYADHQDRIGTQQQPQIAKQLRLADRRVGTQPCKLLRRMRPSLTHYSTSGTSSHEFGCLQSPTAGVGVTSNQAFRYSHIRL